MAISRPIRAGPLAVAVWLVVGGCGRDVATQSDTGSAAAPLGLPARFPAEALRLSGPDDLVLAEGQHGIKLTLAEYNARVDEVPLPVKSDTIQACWGTLARLVDHKVCAAEGRLRGYSTPEARNLRDEERQLARQVLEQGMLNAQLLPDDEAMTFFRAHRVLFPGLTEASLVEPALLMHVKFTLHNQRWRQKVDQWLARERVVVHRERFVALLKERGLAGTAIPPQGGGS